MGENMCNKGFWVKSLWVKKYKGEMPAQEEFLGEKSLDEEYMGEMPVQEEFLGEKSSPKSLCKKSCWVKRLWVKVYR